MAAPPPPLLSPYLALPPELSLVLLTSVLGATTNWLLLRYLQSFLRPSPTPGHQDQSDPVPKTKQEPKVVLVSFLRDLSFWRDGARKLGLDLDKLGTSGRFGYVDGLTQLFLGSQLGKTKDENQIAWQTTLRSSDPDAVYTELLRAVQRLQHTESADDKKAILIIDGLDFILAANPIDWTPIKLGEVLLDLRENVHATVLAIADDDPLVKRQTTSLETNHAAFLISVAHQADLTMGLRLLDTGAARDVSGVIRITVKKDGDGDLREEKLDGQELLYFVGGDGSVKVFERGQ